MAGGSLWREKKQSTLTSQYEAFISQIDVTGYPEEDRFVKNYWRNVRILKEAAICLLVLIVLSVVFDFKCKAVIQAAAVIGVLIYIWYRRRSSRQIRDVLLEECDPGRTLARYVSLLSHAKEQSAWEMHFYNLASTLYYAGRIDDVKKTLSLMKKYYPTPLGSMYYELIEATPSLHNMDREGLKSHCTNMEQLSRTVHLKGTMQYVYYEKVHYPALVQMWDDGNFKELYKVIANAKFLKNTILSEVKRNYYLYMVARALGDEEKMEKHRAYVIRQGKGLWYCAKLEEEAV